MKRILKVLLSSLALISLISCTNEPSSKKEDKTETTSTSSIPTELVWHVTFINDDEDNTVLYEVDVLDGHEAIYRGETPTKEEDDEFTYEFQGWDQDLTNIKSAVTTKAQYNAVPKEDWGPIDWL